LKKRSLWISACLAMAAAVALAGCGSTYYFAGRTLPPSGLVNRVLIAIQNPTALSKGALQIVDAFYDRRAGYNGSPASFPVSGYSGALPISIQSMPEEQYGAVYGSGDGSLALASYAQEKISGTISGLNGLSSSIFITRNKSFVFAASQSGYFTVVNEKTGTSYSLNLPGVYRLSVNPGGSVALAFVQNSNFAYYPIELTSAQSIDYAGGPTKWPTGAVDCEPQYSPAWCLIQALDPSTGSPLIFNRPVKAVFSADGGTAYVLSCGPECGGNSAPVTGFPATAAVTPVPVAPLIFLPGQSGGALPTQSALNTSTIAIPGGASNALVDSSTMYVAGQARSTGQTLFGGNLTVVNLSNSTAGDPVSISDGTPGTPSRMVEADDNTLWIAMTGCTAGIRFATGAAGGYGCLTMYNTSSNTVTMLEPYIGNATGIAAVTGLHKIYTASGGQVYIYSTVDGSSINNQFVTVTGTAYDVAYMDAITDANNTVY
jgi:hypothetical protein